MSDLPNILKRWLKKILKKRDQATAPIAAMFGFIANARLKIQCAELA
jgi:hypothetical protein